MVGTFLDVDPKNLAYDFTPEWLRFHNSRPHQFLVAWFQRSLANLRTELETVRGDRVAELQAEAKKIREVLKLLNRTDVSDELQRTLEFLKHYGNS